MVFAGKRIAARTKWKKISGKMVLKDKANWILRHHWAAASFHLTCLCIFIPDSFFPLRELR